MQDKALTVQDFFPARENRVSDWRDGYCCPGGGGKGEPGSAIMVGDSGTDVRTARNASLPVIAVTFGYSEVPIESLQPDRLISSYGELRAAINGIETAPA